MDTVECRSDHEYADRPLALTWGGQKVEIGAIIAQWHGPNKKGFRVQAVNGQLFELIYREVPDEWNVRPI
jgi:hypothetical protein